jgi:hypothetical protein
MLDMITTLYPTSWKTTPFKLTVAVSYAKSLSQTGGKTAAGPYMQFESQPLPGTYQGAPVANFAQFEAQALYQHTTAYDVLLGVTELSPATRNQAAFMPIVRAMLSGPKGT